ACWRCTVRRSAGWRWATWPRASGASLGRKTSGCCSTELPREPRRGDRAAAVLAGRGAVRHGRADAGQRTRHHPLLRARRRRARLAARLGEAAAAELLARSGAEYDAMVDAGIPHRPGIVALLQWLRQNDVPRAVATSTRNPLASHKLRQAGLEPYFPVICTA